MRIKFEPIMFVNICFQSIKISIAMCSSKVTVLDCIFFLQALVHKTAVQFCSLALKFTH